MTKLKIGGVVVVGVGCEGHEARRDLGPGFHILEWPALTIQNIPTNSASSPLLKCALIDFKKAKEKRSGLGPTLLQRPLCVLLPPLSSSLALSSFCLLSLIPSPFISVPYIVSFLPLSAPSERPRVSYLPSAAPSTKSCHCFLPIWNASASL